MSDSKRRDGVPIGDYEVGYRRPPVATRFKPGNNRNPGGRRKAKKTISQLIDEALNEKVRITVGGRSKTMTKQEVIIHNLVNAAARKDPKALLTLLGLIQRYQKSTETVLDPLELSADDRKIIDAFLNGASRDGSSPNSSPANDQPTAADEAGIHPGSEPDTKT